MSFRIVIVQMWDGPRVVARLGPTTGLSDAEVTQRLRGLGLKSTIPATPEERLARLTEYPTEADLRALERVYTPDNDGVRPRARVLESIARPFSPAGSTVR